MNRSGHPLSSTAFHAFGLRGYAVVFGMGGMFIYVVYMAFLGPAFMTGFVTTGRRFGSRAHP